ncbi:hypothetical protein CHGG_02338 [Chaetomium globosum CBS 148.51]|uniref:TauD/TfdA-like domain-containing protein n=1 Tax=Chaetomium globosum (strain ATCC 6205 / CBS 148.51 / DSM 1962 / NBRC 6347 / NRRL 1970) TaxID=306901 RepID=Q2HBR6_CHAGB|nr:uncharacterized protein CHGG_02338 [Chaetomium globosum CBS 148.51]EAQ90403.1 hypothetical protein CHGG_02338 [Chaetomium globosum CBS 148.51]
MTTRLSNPRSPTSDAPDTIFVTDVPADESAVERVASRIGPVQETFYGRTWDVRNKARAENVAYTDKFLCLHQDLMYHDPVPGLQLLHCLANTCEGGESLFSHAVRAAYELRITQRKSRWLKGTYVSRQDYAAAAERQSKHVLPARGAPYSMWEEEAAMEGALLAQGRKVDAGASRA